MSTEWVMLSNHLILCRLILLLPSVFPSIRIFSSELALLIKWPNYWSFSFSISLSSEYPGLISFRIDWFDLVAVHGLSIGEGNGNPLQCSCLENPRDGGAWWAAFYGVAQSRTRLKRLSSSSSKDYRESYTTQFESINSLMLNILYGPTVSSICDYWKNHSFDYRDLCWQSMSLLFNMLSRLFITFLPRSEHLLISWLQPWSAVILEPKKTKFVTASTFSPSVCHKGMWPDTILVFFFVFFHVEFQASFFTLLFHHQQEAL